MSCQGTCCLSLFRNARLKFAAARIIGYATLTSSVANVSKSAARTVQKVTCFVDLAHQVIVFLLLSLLVHVNLFDNLDQLIDVHYHTLIQRPSW